MVTVWRREITRYLRDKSRIISSLLQPIMFMFIFGSGLSQTLAGGSLAVDYVQFMFPGIVAMGVMGVAFFSTVSTVWDREFGFLKEILVAPVSRTSIAIGKTAAATSIATVQALFLLVLSPFVGVELHLSSLPVLILSMVLLAFAISSFGLLISSLLKTTESFGLVMQFITFPMFFVSGSFFPLNSVPDWMSFIAKINPLSYGVDALRHIILSDFVESEVLDQLVVNTFSTDILFLVAFSSVMIVLAVLAFNKRD